MQKWKSLLAMLSLVIIGFAGGFFTHRYLMQQKIEAIKKQGVHRGFQEHLFRVIDADEKQREKLEPLLQKFAEKLGTIYHGMRAQRAAIMDSLEVALAPELTEVQNEQLREFIGRLKKIHQSRGNREKRPEGKIRKEKL